MIIKKWTEICYARSECVLPDVGDNLHAIRKYVKTRMQLKKIDHQLSTMNPGTSSLLDFFPNSI